MSLRASRRGDDFEEQVLCALERRRNLERRERFALGVAELPGGEVRFRQLEVRARPVRGPEDAARAAAVALARELRPAEPPAEVIALAVSPLAAWRRRINAPAP